MKTNYVIKQLVDIAVLNSAASLSMWHKFPCCYNFSWHSTCHSIGHDEGALQCPMDRRVKWGGFLLRRQLNSKFRSHNILKSALF